jgi:hypothetical protein
MPRDALQKRSRLLDALENPELLPPSPALDTSQLQVDDDQSEEKKEAIDALKRKIYALSTNAGGAPAGPSKRRRVVGARSRVVSDEVSSDDEVDSSVGKRTTFHTSYVRFDQLPKVWVVKCLLRETSSARRPQSELRCLSSTFTMTMRPLRSL